MIITHWVCRILYSLHRMIITHSVCHSQACRVLRFCFIFPVHICELQETRQYGDVGYVGFVNAGLQQQDRRVGDLRQPTGHHSSGGPSANCKGRDEAGQRHNAYNNRDYERNLNKPTKWRKKKQKITWTESYIIKPTIFATFIEDN